MKYVMEIVISLLAMYILIWMIVKPFMLLIIEKENEKYEEKKKYGKNHND
jgi:flagellar biosynthesis/type III secretory pathway M-ring protein FliF/YscJ